MRETFTTRVLGQDPRLRLLQHGTDEIDDGSMMDRSMEGPMEGWVFLVLNAAVHDSTERQSWKTDARSVGRSLLSNHTRGMSE